MPDLSKDISEDASKTAKVIGNIGPDIVSIKTKVKALWARWEVYAIGALAFLAGVFLAKHL